MRSAPKKQTREVQAATAPDPAAKAKRAEKRESRVQTGLDQLETWMADIVSQGLASARAQGSSFWAQMAGRLIDAQAPGLARRVNELGERVITSARWQSELLAGLARLQLLIDGYRNIDRLTPELAAEIRTIVGWTQDQDSLRQREGVRDHWHVIARRQTEGENLKTQITWLHGTSTQRFALLLEFAVGAQPLPANYTVGQVIDAELVYFDGSPPLRALEKERFASEARRLQLPTGGDIASMQAAYARSLATNPWLDRHPYVLDGIRTHVASSRLYLEDAAGRRIAVDEHCRHTWDLVALAGGGALSVFGEWDGEFFEPLAVQRGSELFIVGRYADLPLLSRVA